MFKKWKVDVLNRKKPIVALDFSNIKQVETFLELFGDEKLNVKVGMELFYAHGTDLIDALKDKGHQIFLDLKCHDIPNTVERTMYVLAQAEVDMVNVHALGGSR